LLKSGSYEWRAGELKRIFGILAVWALAAVGTLGASSITCSASYSISGCYTASNFGAGFDSLDWGAPYPYGFGEALVGTTNTGPLSGNYIDPHGSANIDSWNATTLGGLGVAVSLDNPQLPYIYRADNTALAWDALHGWSSPDTIAEDEYGSGINTFDGHFGSPTTRPWRQYSGFGDALIGTSDASGSASGGGPMRFVFSSTVTAGGFRISSATSGNNDNFDAELIAYDINGLVLGTYDLQAFGSGGRCAALTQLDAQGNPGTCDDAPWIGFSGLSGVKYITVEVFDSVTHQDVAYLIDSMMLKEGLGSTGATAPEPFMAPLIGLGLVAFGVVWRKKSRNPA
jgi:hypothetical protein